MLTLQKLIALVVPPPMTYVMVDGKAKAAPMEEVVKFMGTNKPFVYSIDVPNKPCKVVVIFLCVNVDQVWAPKLFAVDVHQAKFGIHHVTKCRTLAEAKRWAVGMAAQMNKRQTEEDTGGLFSA